MAYQKKVKPLSQKAVEATEKAVDGVKYEEGTWVEEESGKPLSDDPSYVPEPAEEPESVFEEPEEVKSVKSALNTKIRARLAEIEEQGKSAVYPTNEGNWDQALLDHLNKL